jgi:conjugal transfer mating pair stabilization protein TraN
MSARYLGWLVISLFVANVHAQQQAATPKPPPISKPQIMQEARATGNAAAATINSNLATTTAQQATPGYTASPPATAYANGNQQTLANATAQRNFYCAQNRTDPQCQNESHAQTQAAATLATRQNMSNDPSVVNARVVSSNPGSVIGTLGGTYSACRTERGSTGGPTYDTQSCYNYFLRQRGSTCTKTLNVRFDFACQSGQTGPLTIPPATTPICRQEVRVDKYRCEPGDTGPTASFGGIVFICTRPDGSAYNAIPDGTETKIIDSPADQVEINEWSADCAPLEANVPAGLLPPDGENPPIPDDGLTGGVPTGSLAKCARVDSTCSSSGGTRTIDGREVTRACWGYTNTFDCVTLDARSDCSQPRFGTCTQQGQPTCVDVDPIEPQLCTTQKIDFKCETRNTSRPDPTLNCGTQTFTDREGTQWDTGYAPDRDFAKVAAFIEAGREAGRYLDPNNLEIFKGYDSRCKKKLYGIVNCCNRGGTSSLSSFTDFSALALIAGSDPKKQGSKFTYDGLFGGSNSSLGGLSLEQLLPTPWGQATMMLALAQMGSCDKAEKDLAMKRDAELCVDIGSYCSRRILGCFERTQTYCCFNSRLAKAINVQGKRQLGVGMGDAKNPNCKGFSPAELQRLDLAAMDLTEFLDEVKAAVVTPTNNSNPTACYYQGQCTPPPR